MGTGIRLGKVFDIEIRLDWSWFIVFFLLAWSLSVGVFPRIYQFPAGLSWLLGIVAALLLFASVLVHELSHALVARRHGVEINGITLFLFGGVAQLRGEPPSPRAEFFIAGIGPVVSIGIGLVCLAFAQILPQAGAWRPLVALFGYLGAINLILAVFNLIPGFPLDGGRLLRSAIWRYTNDLRKATRIASYAGRGFAWFLIGYGLLYEVLWRRNLGGLWLVFIGWFLNNAAEAAYQQLLLRRALSGVAVADVMTPDVPGVDADMRVREFVEEYLLRHDFTVYPVMRGEEFVGVVTLEDIRRVERDSWDAVTLGNLAHSPADERTVRDDEDAWDALTQMLESDAQRLLVMDDGRLRGIVSRDAIIRLVQRKMSLGMGR